VALEEIGRRGPGEIPGVSVDLVAVEREGAADGLGEIAIDSA
jgi:hypothetical protein